MLAALAHRRGGADTVCFPGALPPGRGQKDVYLEIGVVYLHEK